MSPFQKRKNKQSNERDERDQIFRSSCNHRRIFWVEMKGIFDRAEISKLSSGNWYRAW
jgi:hypothetical protein